MSIHCRLLTDFSFGRVLIPSPYSGLWSDCKTSGPTLLRRIFPFAPVVARQNTAPLVGRRVQPYSLKAYLGLCAMFLFEFFSQLFLLSSHYCSPGVIEKCTVVHLIAEDRCGNANLRCA